MKLQQEYTAGHLCVRLQGELDHHSAAETFREIEAALDRYLPRSCALDLSGLSFMDSSGVAVILRTNKQMGETGGKLWVADPSPQPARVLSASGVGRLVTIKGREGKPSR